MTNFNIDFGNILERIIDRLAKETGIFHSEADFKFSLAWALKEINPDNRIILEYKIGNRRYLDIFLLNQVNNKSVGIELKYFTSKFDYKNGIIEYNLKEQSAQDQMRYLAIKDIHRLEVFIKDKKFDVGYALWLTNVSPLLNDLGTDTADKAFRINQGRIIEPGLLKWGDKAKPGTTKYKPNFEINGQYEILWNNYPYGKPNETNDQKNSLFSYSITEVVPQ